MSLKKGNFMKKIAIILIIIMLLSAILPHYVEASLSETILDVVGGILFKPIFAFVTSLLVTVDATIGVTLNGLSIGISAIDTIIEAIKGDGEGALASLSETIGKIFVGPDTIFSGDVNILNANIFKSFDDSTPDSTFDALVDALGKIEDAVSGKTVMNKVRNAIARIYYILRNICGFIMLGGLIFTGIRILLSSNIPTKKTQYLNLIEDWLIGMALLVLSHVLMAGVFYISDAITKALAFTLNGFGGLNFKIMCQLIFSIRVTEQIILTIMLAYLIWQTVIFAISYFKRLVWVSVLVIFAPVFSVMYAFGPQTKQIYSKWIREFCMTVFIQPFHIIVYSVLIQIPLGSVGQWSLDGSSTFTLIYALLSIGMIRPAEKYMRQLFGMDRGIANMASYDSGKQTFDAVKNTVKQVAGTVMKVGAVAFTGGAGAGLMAGKGAAAAKTTSALSGAAKEAGGALKGLTEAGSKTEGVLGNSLTNGAIDGGLKNGMSSWENEGNGQWGAGDTWNDARGYLKFTANNEGYDSVAALRESYGDDGINDLLDRGGYKPEDLNNFDGAGYKSENEESSDELHAERVGNEVGNAVEGSTQNKESLSGNINANNVTINASNIQMQGNGISGTEGVKSSSVEVETLEEKNETNETIAEASTTPDEEISDKDFEVIDSGEEKQEKGRTKNPFKRALNTVRTASDVLNGRTSVFDTEVGGKIASKLPEGLQEKGRLFEEMGGGTELYKGLNSIRDTMFVDGAAPRDWQGTAKSLDEKKKQKDEKAIYNFTTNNENKEFATMQYKQEAMQKYKDPDKQQEYIDKKLENLAKAYAPLGVTDASLAYSLKKDEKKYGYTPEEALIHRGNQMRGFEKFNSNKSNVVEVNNKYETNATNVSEVIPNAQEYYNNGYDNVNNMMDAQFIQDALRTTSDMAMRLENALRNSGKVNYNGTDERIRAKFDEINQYYENKLKGGK